MSCQCETCVCKKGAGRAKTRKLKLTVARGRVISSAQSGKSGKPLAGRAYVATADTYHFGDGYWQMEDAFNKD